MLTLIQFVLRLAFGMALSMLFVSPRQVTSGYYRNNLYVLLGLNVLAALLAANAAGGICLWVTIFAAAASYVGAVLWLYERPTAGMAALAVVAAADVTATYFALPLLELELAPTWLTALDAPSGGLLLGATMAAMLLGHWYLNAPGMPLAPLIRLIALVGVAVVIRAAVCAAGVALSGSHSGSADSAQLLFVALRWIGGIAGTMLLAFMAYRTLKIPNTQSATGILYVAVLTTFLGELASGLLSARTGFPL